MFRVFFLLGVIFFAALIVSVVWTKYVHKFLFEEGVEDKLENAAEKRIMMEADKKATEIIESESLEEEV